LSGPKNIVLLLSMSYVANWVRRMPAKHFAEVCALSSKELHLLAWAPSLLHVAWYNCDCRFQLIRRPIVGPIWVNSVNGPWFERDARFGILLQQIERYGKEDYILHQEGDIALHRRKTTGCGIPTVRHKRDDRDRHDEGNT
jgi:hypothetical protein